MSESKATARPQKYTILWNRVTWRLMVVRSRNNSRVQAMAGTSGGTTYTNNNVDGLLQNTSFIKFRSIQDSRSDVDNNVTLVHVVYALIDKLTMILGVEAIAACRNR